MNTTALQTPTQQPAATTDRVNLYVTIHKALRSLMTDTLGRVGRIDMDDAAEVAATLAQVGLLLEVCTDHVRHENEFMHTAIEARQPAGAARTGADHVEHLESIAALREETAALAAASGDIRHTLALRLYRHLALFVAENFQHMHIEETVNAAALWAHYSDAELHQIHDRLLATITPQQHLLIARWMIPAMTPAERAAMVGGMKLQTPPEALLGVLEYVRPFLDAKGWVGVTRAAGVAQQPGLVNMP